MTSDDKTRAATHDDVVRLAGDLGELRIASILETGASVGELEEACTLASGDGEATGAQPAELVGPVAEIYAILTIDEAYEEDR